MPNLETSYYSVMDDLDLIAIGDTTVDVFFDLEEAAVNCELDTNNCKLLLNYAEKIPVKKVVQVPGVGNAANCTVGATRLGLKTALYTVIGKDHAGQQIKDILIKEKIICDYLQEDEHRGSNYSAVINYLTERTILVYHEPRDYNLPPLPKAKWLYFSSVAHTHGQLYNQILDYLETNQSLLGFNPGTYQLQEGLSTLEPIIKNTDVLILNREEGKKLLGRDQDPAQLAESLYQLGAKKVIVTNSASGAYAYDGEHHYYQPILECAVVERTGAGDAFSTGVITALVYGFEFSEALRWGTINAWSVLQYIGAQEGLLAKAKMQELLHNNPQLQPQIN